MIPLFENPAGARIRSAPTLTEPAAPVDERPESLLLLEAWFGERGRSVERSLLLGRVRDLLTRILAEGQLTEPRTREVRQLLDIIGLLESD